MPLPGNAILRTGGGIMPMPMWRFDVRWNGAGRERTMWMGGTFGSVFDKSP